MIALVVAAALLGGGIAEAQEGPTRGGYVERLEPMCKPGAEATRRTMKGARGDVRNPRRVGAAARKFSRAGSIFAGTISRIGRVPRPVSDTARLKKWFIYLNRQEDYLTRISAQLRNGNTIKAQRLLARFIHNGNLANNVTLAFGFNYCSFKFSRYG